MSHALDNDGQKNEENEALEAREYQIQLLSIALNENVIVYLPTGSGKTFVAVMLIMCLSEDLKKPYKQGGKRSIFAVNTITLVKQQGDYIAKHTPFTVGKYSGDLNFDYLNQDRWNSELTNNQVIVLTSQILLDALLKGFIKLEDINLIIFDECHHAVHNHCMRRIMMQFEKCPKKLQPRVLGLSGSLLNCNTSARQVEEEIKKLESTFQGRVVTFNHFSQVNQFSTKPIERIISFVEGSPITKDPNLCSLKGRVLNEIKAAMNTVDYVNSSVFSSEIDESMVVGNIQKLNHTSGAKQKKKLRSTLHEVKVIVEELGLYGGFWAALSAVITLYRRKFAVDTDEGKAVIAALITHMLLIRKMISDEFQKCSEQDVILKFSTYKVLNLLELLRECESDHAITVHEGLISKQKNQKSYGLIFVERRQTAKTLFQILKCISQHDPTLKTIKPEFVVGIASNRTLSNLEKKQHHEAIKKFRNGDCNYLVASDVLEEGVDIPQCSLVIKFDLPKSIRSYVQSKGRARHSTSKYIMFVPDGNSNYQEKLEEFRRVERILREKLIGNNDLRKCPSEDEVKNTLYQTDIPNYYSSGGSAVIDLTSAISYVSRYCSLLPHDKFTQLYPLWLLDDLVTVKAPDGGNKLQIKKIAYLQLPINSPLRNIVKGIPMENKRQAKKAVALITCAALHQIGEIGDNFLPINHDIEMLDNSILFPNWRNESSEDGAKKRKRLYNKEVPNCLTQCHPKAGEATFVYHIHQTTNFEQPSPLDSCASALYEVLNMKRGYAIITSKELPEVCDFPIYISSGEIGVRIGKEENQKEIVLTSEEISALEDFNYMLFSELLNVCKQFVIADKSTANSFLVAPTCLDASGAWVIDWNVVREFSSLPFVEIFNPEKKDELIVDDNNFLYEVVTPWYYGVHSEKHYMVTKICEDMHAGSKFPSTKYKTFEKYFKDKYSIHISRPELPLLEVKAIPSHIDGIHPRQNKSKQVYFNEHMIPELVSLRKFPSTLWLKAGMLPTTFQWLHHMLLAYELQAQIWKETKIGAFGPPSGNHWRPLKVQVNHAEEGHCRTPITNGMDLGSYERFGLQSSEKFIKDLDREIEELSLKDIMQHQLIVMKETDPQVIENDEWETVGHAVIPPEVQSILIRDTSLGTSEIRGPELADVLSAITEKSANIDLNLERLETLGDSFLKFAVSTYLYLKFPDRDEGKLTAIKSKIVSNRNLFYCAEKKGLGGMINNCPFGQQSEWIPPGFIVPQFLEEVIVKYGGVIYNVLSQSCIPENERQSGHLSLKTKHDIIKSIEENKINDTDIKLTSKLEALLGKQRIRDKTMADSVEALIGAWLINGGTPSALCLLGWFGILPSGPNGPAKSWEQLVGDETLTSARDGFINEKNDSVMIGGEVHWDPDYQHDIIINQTANFQCDLVNADGWSGRSIESMLRNATSIEELLQYKFKNRHLLLQALTHASYNPNRITDCYQRLEFLGDAVLDFIITCHIYETCGKLNPGQLTDLRSALVNNITFASLVVRHGLHRHLLHLSPLLMAAIERFVKFQLQRNHKITEECLILMEEDECHIAESVEVPKALGDIFESLAGAIFLDSGYSLIAVWEVFYPIMRKEIDAFSIKVPKQPVRDLIESYKVKFLPSVSVTPPAKKGENQQSSDDDQTQDSNGMYQASGNKTQKSDDFIRTFQNSKIFKVTVEVFDQKIGKQMEFIGFGERKDLAKRAAAKIALRALRRSD